MAETLDNTTETWQSAQAAVLRGQVARNDLAVHYAGDKPAWRPDGIYLPKTTDLAPATPQARAVGDELAAQQQFYNAGLAQQFKPNDATQASWFDALAQARYRALAAQQWPGCTTNFNAAYAVSHHVLAWAQDGFNMWCGQPSNLPPLLFNLFEGLQPHLNNQKKFYELVAGWLAKYPNLDQLPLNLDSSDDGTPTATTHADDTDKDWGEEPTKTITLPSDDKPENNPSDNDQPEPPAGEPQAEQPDFEQGTHTAQAPENVPDNYTTTTVSRLARYKIFSTQFDEEVAAHTLASTAERRTLRQQLDQQMQHLRPIIAQLALKLQRHLQSKPKRRRVYDTPDGLLDTTRLARLISGQNFEAPLYQHHVVNKPHTAVTLLLDNSGSMRGRPIMMTALCAEILAQTLERCHVKVEILGFTTAGWKGGQSAKLWQAQSHQPAQPGRLNDVRHIVYKSFNQTNVAAKENLPIMLKDGVLRENIDGEALLWAYSRLARQPEQRKILLAISDGAPVDDATLAANGADYLENHLHDVVHALSQVPQLDLLAIGIGHDVGRYYPNAIKIKNADELGDVLVKELVKLL